MDAADRKIHALGEQASQDGDPDLKIRRAAAAGSASNHAAGVAKILRAGRAALAALRHPDEAEREERRLAAARAAAAVPMRKAMVTPDDLGPNLERLDAQLAKLHRLSEPVPPAPPPAAPATRRPPVAQSSAPRAASPTPALRGGHLRYWDFRDQVARGLRRGYLNPTAASIAEYGERLCGLSKAEAAEMAERFLKMATRDLRRRR